MSLVGSSRMANLHDKPLSWSISRLTDAYRRGELSPIDVTDAALARIDETDARLHAYVRTTAPLARQQAEAAGRAYRDGSAGPLAGVPISIKDAFHIAGEVTTLGSLAHVDDVAAHDSGSVRRLREAGAVFVGKTNVPEFCQSATTDNLLGPDSTNPWDVTRTPGGSTGGGAASVAAGTCFAALGSDGGGSIRIPSAFCGLVGLKPTIGRCADEGGFQGFSPFCSLGPLTWRVSDARIMFAVLAEEIIERAPVQRGLRMAWCARPEGRPVDSALLDVVSGAVTVLEQLGHQIDATDLPLQDWKGAFGPLILAEEGELRGHLLAQPERLTEYERLTLEAAVTLDKQSVLTAQQLQYVHRETVNNLFEQYDILVTPATAVPAFPLRQRPRAINGQRVSKLWGAFPFSVPFNVSGHPAIVLPAGLVDGLPVAIQLVAPAGREHFLLDVAEQLEDALALELFKHDLPERNLPL